MRNKSSKAVLFALASLLFLASAAVAVEITPFSGYRMGGQFENWYTGTNIDLRDAQNYGVAIDFDIAPGKQIELFYSHQNTTARIDTPLITSDNWDMDVDYYHIGGVSNFHNFRKFKPFVAGTIGTTYFNPEKMPSESRFSLSLAGGGKLMLSDRIGLRMEARSYWTLFDSYSAIFCGNGGCSVGVSGSAWWQFETNVGVIVKF